MSIVAVIIALVLAFLAFRFVTGIIKFVVILVVLGVAAYFVLHGMSA